MQRVHLSFFHFFYPSSVIIFISNTPQQRERGCIFALSFFFLPCFVFAVQLSPIYLYFNPFSSLYFSHISPAVPPETYSCGCSPFRISFTLCLHIIILIIINISFLAPHTALASGRKETLPIPPAAAGNTPILCVCVCVCGHQVMHIITLRFPFVSRAYF